jgi:hypothetical protein
VHYRHFLPLPLLFNATARGFLVVKGKQRVRGRGGGKEGEEGRRDDKEVDRVV